MSKAFLRKLAILASLTLLSACIPLPQDAAPPVEEEAVEEEAVEEPSEETEETEEYEETEEDEEEVLEVETKEAATDEEEVVEPETLEEPGEEEVIEEATEPEPEPEPTPAPTPEPTEAIPPPEPVPQAAESAVREIVVDVTTWSFTPSTITAKQGESVVLVLHGGEGTHGFAVPELGINVSVAPGETKRIPLPTGSPGTFLLFCSIPCGAGHSDMRGAVVISA